MEGQRVKKVKREDEETCDSVSSKQHHPFSQSIMAAPLPNGFKISKIESYDGLTDPEYHLKLFDVHMLFYGFEATDSIQCRVFPCTLRNYALKWFFTLPPNSINNFSQLRSKFLSRFVLNNVKQRDDELSKDYLDRFNQEAKKVHNLCPENHILLIMQGLKSGPFSYNLSMRKPLSLNEIWERAQWFVDREIEKIQDQQR